MSDIMVWAMAIAISLIVAFAIGFLFGPKCATGIVMAFRWGIGEWREFFKYVATGKRTRVR